MVIPILSEMIRTRCQKLLTILILWFPIILSAQVKILDPIINPEHVKIHQLRMEEGMSSHVLLGSYLDQYGFLWIGGQTSVDVYGSETYGSGNQTAYLLNYCMSIPSWMIRMGDCGYALEEVYITIIEMKTSWFRIYPAPRFLTAV
jgi:hypothetical protein